MRSASGSTGEIMPSFMGRRVFFSKMLASSKAGSPRT